MAAKLVKYYNLIEAFGGSKAKMRMVMLTSVAAFIADSQPDSAANLARFKAAYKEITGREAPPV